MLVFIMETKCVLCAVSTDVLNAVWSDFLFQGVNTEYMYTHEHRDEN